MRTLVVPIYGFSLHIGIGEEFTKVVSYINRRLKKVGSTLTDHELMQLKENINPLKNYGFFFPLEASGHGVIWLDSHVNLRDIKTFITLSHEANHMSIAIFDYIKSEVNLQTQEPFCYLHDYIMEKCLEEVEKYGNINTSTKPAGSV